jgi:hypothetical protein
MPIIPDLPVTTEPATSLRSLVVNGRNARQEEVRLEVFAGTDPRVDCSFVIETSPGVAEPFDIFGADLEFYRKGRIQDPDGDPLYSTDEGTIAITDGVGGQASVQFAAADLPRRGQFRFHIDAIRGDDGQRTTLAWGPLTVLDR